MDWSPAKILQTIDPDFLTLLFTKWITGRNSWAEWVWSGYWRVDLQYWSTLNLPERDRPGLWLKTETLPTAHLERAQPSANESILIGSSTFPANIAIGRDRIWHCTVQIRESPSQFARTRRRSRCVSRSQPQEKPPGNTGWLPNSLMIWKSEASKVRRCETNANYTHFGLVCEKQLLELQKFWTPESYELCFCFWNVCQNYSQQEATFFFPHFSINTLPSITEIILKY